jgi:hypothetical protein
MKTMHYLCILALLSLSVGCKEKIDPEAEKEAIIEVINEETQAYLDFDFEKLKSFYIHDSLNFRLTTGADDYVFLEGWDEVEQFFRDQLEIEVSPEMEPDTNIKIEKSNYRIKVYENAAFVICDEKWIYDSPVEPVVINSYQVRFLEKVEDEWKIAFLSFIGTSGYEDENDVADAEIMDE